MDAPYLVTGAAGFIGFHAASALLRRGATVIGVDDMNDHLDGQQKRERLSELHKEPHFSLCEGSIEEPGLLADLATRHECEIVLHLAAQAGVRFSCDRPEIFCRSNLAGFLQVLEAARRARLRHLVYASSSSVYGTNRRMPFSERDSVDHPVSFYAATKKANELMAHSYSRLYDIPTTGLRFFTIYGPWGRPDMAVFKFTRAILEGTPIDVYNHGRMKRDFTYIDDAVDGILRVIDRPAAPSDEWDPMSPRPDVSDAPYRIYNIGNDQPVELNRLIALLEKGLGKSAIRNNLPLQAGDVEETWADIQRARIELGYCPTTTIESGIEQFVNWYRGHYGV